FGDHYDVLDDRADLLHHPIKVVGQSGDFVAAVGGQAPGQIATTIGNGAERLTDDINRMNDQAAGEQVNRDQAGDQQHNHHQGADANLLRENGLLLLGRKNNVVASNHFIVAGDLHPGAT